jgi:hypothetical protein
VKQAYSLSEIAQKRTEFSENEVRAYMTDFAERIKHYETKCRQHLNRVRLSHELALGALSAERVQTNEFVELIHASFDEDGQDRYEAEVRSGLSKLHLLSLKANFELFLNRVLSTVLKFQWPNLSSVILRDAHEISVRELAASFAHATDSSGEVQEFIIDRIVPSNGLGQFERVLEQATGIRLRRLIYGKDKTKRCWPQIYTAFAVRHLVEHREGRVDQRFREQVVDVWAQSTWGKCSDLERLDKVPVEKEDVAETCTAMLEATSLLSGELLSWSSSQAGITFRGN